MDTGTYVNSPSGDWTKDNSELRFSLEAWLQWQVMSDGQHASCPINN